VYTLSIGICSGLFLAGIISAVQFLIPMDKPLWPDYEALTCLSPLLTHVISCVSQYVQLTMIFSLLCILIDTATRKWQKHCLFFTIFAAFCGMAMIDLPSFDMLSVWIIIGTMVGLVLLAMYRYVIRYDYALIPLATTSFTILHIIQQGIFNAYPGASIAACISACMIGTVSALWYWYVTQQDCFFYNHRP